jgi:hypothetical protein
VHPYLGLSIGAGKAPRDRVRRVLETRVSFKGAHFEGAIILVCVHGYLAYPLFPSFI